MPDPSIPASRRPPGTRGRRESAPVAPSPGNPGCHWRPNVFDTGFSQLQSIYHQDSITRCLLYFPTLLAGEAQRRSSADRTRVRGASGQNSPRTWHRLGGPRPRDVRVRHCTPLRRSPRAAAFPRVRHVHVRDAPADRGHVALHYASAGSALSLVCTCWPGRNRSRSAASTASATSGFSFRNCRAFSFPWPMRSLP